MYRRKLVSVKPIFSRVLKNEPYTTQLHKLSSHTAVTYMFIWPEQPGILHNLSSMYFITEHSYLTPIMPRSIISIVKKFMMIFHGLGRFSVKQISLASLTAFWWYRRHVYYRSCETNIQTLELYKNSRKCKNVIVMPSAYKYLYTVLFECIWHQDTHLIKLLIDRC